MPAVGELEADCVNVGFDFAVCLHVCCDLSGRSPLFLVYLVEQQLQRKVKLPEFVTFI